VLHPLHHLGARDNHIVLLSELLFQTVEGQVIVEAGQDNVDSQSQPQLALRDQAWRQRGDGHTRLAAGAGVLGTHGAAADQVGGDEIDLLADFLADPAG